MTSKLIRLLRLAKQNPREFSARVGAVLDVQRDRFFAARPEYAVKTLEQAVGQMPQPWREKFFAHLEEDALKEIVQLIEERVRTLHLPFVLVHNADVSLAKTLYACCRMLAPRVVIETGVAHGVSTTFLLKALAENGHGHLFSIDLPPLAKDADTHVGTLVPENLRQRWTLHRGTSRQILPKILAEAGQVELFVHDSLHTYANMAWEFKTVQAYLSGTSAVISDDVNGNQAFDDWVLRSTPKFSTVFNEETKNSYTGIALFCDENPSGS